MAMTASHWVFILVMMAILAAMPFSRGVIILSLVGTVILALLSPNSGAELADKTIFSVQAMFKAAMIAGTSMFDTVLLVSFLVALLRSMHKNGVDALMIRPFAKLFRGPRSTFLALAVTSWICSLFFWPTPSIALIGVVLIPLAVRAGLPALAAAAAINLAGHGTALSADPIIQAAIRITGAPAGLAPSDVLPHAMAFSLIVSAIAFGWMFWRVHSATRDAAQPEKQHLPEQPAAELNVPLHTRLIAIAVPLLLFATVWIIMARPATAMNNGTAAALLGGTALILAVLISFVQDSHHAMDTIVGTMTEGFYFAIRIFGPVVPVLGFFLMGNAQTATEVLGPNTPGLLNDLTTIIGAHGMLIKLAAPVLIVLIAVTTGLDGTAFTGLPLVGAAAIILSGGDPYHAALLAGMGQVAATWVGASTVLTRSGLATVAEHAHVDEAALAQNNRGPVIAGLTVMTLCGMWLMH